MKTTALLACLLALAPAARAAGAGADPFNFLFLDADARPAALGGAYTALAGDSNALLYNPAGLAAVHGHEASFMHDQHFAGITQEYLAYASRWGWGANLNTLDFGQTPETSYSNPTGAGLGSVGLSDLALGVGYGRELLPGLRVGAGGKLIREAIAGVVGRSFAADLGVQDDVGALPGLTLGAALQNIGPAVKFDQASEPLPLNARLGAAWRFSVLGQRETASLDLTKERSEAPLVAVGVETLAGGMLPIRVGFTTRNQAGPGFTFGLGWTQRNFSVDYAFVPYGDLGTSHHFSVAVRWGQQEYRDARAESADREALRAQDDPNDRFDAADAAATRGDWTEARRQLEAARRLLPKGDRRLVLYYQKSGVLSYEQGSPDDAADYFDQAIDAARKLGTAGPAVAGSYLGLARCLSSEDDVSGARRALKKALEVGPSDSQRREIEEELNLVDSGGARRAPKRRTRL